MQIDLRTIMVKTIADFVHLTDIQKQVLNLLNRHEVFYKNFYFTGGTLLKAHGIVPRESNDLDFFTFSNINTGEFPLLLKSMKNILVAEFGEKNLTPAPKGFLHNPSGMVIELIADGIKPIDDLVFFDQIATDGLKDIAAKKASALCCRDEVKDLIDIAFLTKRQDWTLADLAEFAQEKFQIGTMQEEKLFEELLSKKKMFVVTPERFLFDGEKNARLVSEQIEHLLTTSSL